MIYIIRKIRDSVESFFYKYPNSGIWFIVICLLISYTIYVYQGGPIGFNSLKKNVPEW